MGCYAAGFSRKKMCIPCWGYQFFWSWPPLDFQSNLPWAPWNFLFFFAFTPWNPCFFFKFWFSPWNSNDFYSTPLEFFIDFLNRGGGYNFFFLEKPNAEDTHIEDLNFFQVDFKSLNFQILPMFFTV